jgi:hypothetical protein
MVGVKVVEEEKGVVDWKVGVELCKNTASCSCHNSIRNCIHLGGRHAFHPVQQQRKNDNLDIRYIE